MSANSEPRVAANGGPGAGSPGKGDWVRIAASMTVTCAIGAAVLGGIFLLTDRYATQARARTEHQAIAELLGLDASATVLPVEQDLTRDRGAVVYRVPEPNGGTDRELTFALDGTLLSDRHGAAPETPKDFIPLGKFFVAKRGGTPAGFVVEGETRGYKNRIRFFVGLTPTWDIAGVRVVEHEEDPGLGAEVATPWFQSQFTGRPLAQVPNLDVTRDPAPEDWRAALRATPRTSTTAWNTRYGTLRARESAHPIYAVTGATISSRALTDGVRGTILHFKRRWDLLAPYLEARP